MTYNPGQLSVLFDCLPVEPSWMIIGGPADADEAITAVNRWKGVRCLGCEPNRSLYDWQLSNGWPIGHPLLPVALSDKVGTLPMMVDDENPRTTSAMVERRGDLRLLPCLTVDYLDLMYGPFDHAVLWLDVEGHELEAIRGAFQSIHFGRIMAVNVEVLDRLADRGVEIDQMLTGQGFRLVKTWNKQPGLCEDRIYVC